MTRLEEIVQLVYRSGVVSFDEAVAILAAVATTTAETDEAYGTVPTTKLRELRDEYCLAHRETPTDV